MPQQAAAAGLTFSATLLAGPALAHATLDQAVLPADSYVRIALRVPHGCEGAATTGVRLQVPTVLCGVQAMPVAGWSGPLGLDRAARLI
jgi:uncharacterized protein YcnI